ncbi:MAG TPA: hypothetical protein VHB21_25165, partial [Minicystis sp.]|nr:hypothetical protein [Minicystis sp.]
VRWVSSRGAACERWIPCRHGMAVRRRDRVLVTQPTNWAELVVTGVIDGFATRPEPERTGPALSLLPDERIRITDAAGAPLLDVVPGDDGPVLKLLTRDLNLDVDGKLRIRARDLELQARAGGVHVEARDAVVVKGETIDLN